MEDCSAITAAAALLDPLLPEDRRRVVADAVSRLRLGRVRVLVLGQAKRGKSTLVNRLFAAPLLPTGALPLTSVATVATVGPERPPQARYRDGRTVDVRFDEVAVLVSERGNPGNALGVDQVRVTAPTPWLPDGTEVVDTPGTGSVHEANTEEARRARSALDVGVLVVAADPPASAAELDLLAEAAATGSRVVVVVNKVDLLDEAVWAEVVDFTRDVASRRLGAPVPVFAMSALPDRPGSGGFAVFADWLRDELAAHGAAHALGATRRVVRREADALRDALRVEEELLRRRGAAARDTLAALSGIIAGADDRTHAALDQLHGDASRLHRGLDESSAAALAQALRDSERLVGRSWEQAGGGSPERRAAAARSALVDATGSGARRWYDGASAELVREVGRSVQRAMGTLTADLDAARAAAGVLLDLDLSPVADAPRSVEIRPPSFEASVTPGWEELVSTTLRRGLPAALRRRILLRETHRWRLSAVPRPFGRACSALHGALREAQRTAERGVEAARQDYVDGLRRGLAAVRDDDARTDGAVRSALAAVAVRARAVDEARALLASTVVGRGADG